jgi:hypothetical protein
MCLPENFKGLEGRVLDTSNCFGSRQEDDGKAWDANDAGEKKV